MSQRASGYQRRPRDEYSTPAWATLALGPHIPPRIRRVWEPCAGTGQMVRALQSLNLEVESSDISEGVNFLDERSTRGDGIICNPPYGLGEEFIEHALTLTAPQSGFVAMLLAVDFDSAKTRARLFAGCRAFSKKIVLTRRIVWFQRPGAAPSSNHVWFMWDHRHQGHPTVAYYVESSVAS